MKKRSCIFVLGLICLSFIFSSCVIIADWNKSYIWIKNNSPYSCDVIESVHIKYDGEEGYSPVDNYVSIKEGEEEMFVVDSGRVKIGIVTVEGKAYYSKSEDLVAGETYYLEFDEEGTHFGFCD